VHPAPNIRDEELRNLVVERNRAVAGFEAAIVELYNAPPARVEQPAVEVEYPALRPQSPPQALQQRAERPHPVEVDPAFIAAAARPPRHIRNPALLPPRPRPIRKSLDAACYVCLDDFEGPEGAVWCRGGCGQNVHAECFENWRRIQAADGRHSSCPFWYVDMLTVRFRLYSLLTTNIFSRERWVDA
jgi:hypothetical protein